MEGSQSINISASTNQSERRDKDEGHSELPMETTYIFLVTFL